MSPPEAAAAVAAGGIDFSVNGLPLHVLVVHFVVAAVPATALAVVLAAVWPAAARRLGLLPVLLAALCLALVPVTTAAGEWLLARVPATPLIDEHAALGGNLLPWTVGMLVVAVVGYAVHRRRARGGRSRSRERLAVAVLIAVLAVGTSAGALLELVRIGESGARAVWQGTYSEEPLER